MATRQNIWIIVRFGVRDNIRFLSHAETVRVFERACLRAGLNMRYSQGFNPHPRISLPFPRPVGVESCDEIACIGLSVRIRDFDCNAVKAELSRQMPEGIDIDEVELSESKVSLEAGGAVYSFEVLADSAESVRLKAEEFLGRESYVLERRKPGKPVGREVDVRKLVKSIEVSGGNVDVRYVVRPSGTVRIDEIMEVLGVEVADLAGAVKRRNVEWIKKK